MKGGPVLQLLPLHTPMGHRAGRERHLLAVGPRHIRAAPGPVFLLDMAEGGGRADPRLPKETALWLLVWGTEGT